MRTAGDSARTYDRRLARVVLLLLSDFCALAGFSSVVFVPVEMSGGHCSGQALPSSDHLDSLSVLSGFAPLAAIGVLFPVSALFWSGTGTEDTQPIVAVLSAKEPLHRLQCRQRSVRSSVSLHAGADDNLICRANKWHAAVARADTRCVDHVLYNSLLPNMMTCSCMTRRQADA